jgi:tRNA A37 threonylcarbamoyltransferase TsaD
MELATGGSESRLRVRQPEAFNLPRPRSGETLTFSFSGLRLRWLTRTAGSRGCRGAISHFQAAVVESLTSQAGLARQAAPLAVCGGGRQRQLRRALQGTEGFELSCRPGAVHRQRRRRGLGYWRLMAERLT